MVARLIKRGLEVFLTEAPKDNNDGSEYQKLPHDTQNIFYVEQLINDPTPGTPENRPGELNPFFRKGVKQHHAIPSAARK